MSALAELLTVEAWMDRAACKGMNPDLFFPNRGDSESVAMALEVCRGCPVTKECLAYSNRPPVEKDGIWGAQTARQRRRRRAAHQQHRHVTADHGTISGYEKHRWKKEPACPACRDAMSAYRRARRSALREGPP